MPTIEVIPGFCARVFATMRDGDYVTLHHGTHSQSSRWGPNAKPGHESDEQLELDELFGTPESMTDALTELVETLKGCGTVRCQVFHSGARKPHDSFRVDQWDAPVAAMGLVGLAEMSQRTGTSMEALALVQLTTNVLGEVPKVLRELRVSLTDARLAQGREVEADRRLIAANAEAAVIEALARGGGDSAQSERSHELMMALVNGAAPALAPILGQWVAKATGAATGAESATPDPKPAPEPGTPEADAVARVDALLVEFKDLGTTPEGRAAIEAQKMAFIEAVTAMQSGGA